MPPNRQYLQQELADALGMSRTPVREALIRLSEERLVVLVPRHGVRVLPISADDMREIYELLAELEALAARRVAERGLSAERISKLENVLTGMEDALDRGDLMDWAGNDDHFHRLIVELAQNTRLAHVTNTMWDQVHRIRMQTLHLRPRPTASNGDHTALVAAIRRQDAQAAAEIHHGHRARAGKMLLQLLQERGLVDV